MSFVSSVNLFEYDIEWCERRFVEEYGFVPESLGIPLENEILKGLDDEE